MTRSCGWGSSPRHLGLYAASVNEELGNPAGRLHYALANYDRARQGATALDAWGAVLGTSPGTSEILPRLAKLASQVPELRARLDVVAPRQVANFDRYADAIYSPILGTGQALVTAQAGTQVNEHVLAWLSSTAELLHAYDSHFKVGADDDRVELRDLLEAARDAVRSDAKLTSDLKLHLIELVDRAIRALDEIELVGPEAVMAQVDQIVVVVSKNQEKTANSISVLKKVWTKAYATMVTATVVAEGAESVDQIAAHAAKLLGN